MAFNDMMIRNRIAQYFERGKARHDFSSLENLGIYVTKDSPDTDCLADACIRLSLPANHSSLDLITNHAIKSQDPLDGSAILYFDETKGDKRFVHAGVYAKDRVLSKWDLDHLVEHPLELVPLQFGNSIEIYRITNRVYAQLAEYYMEGFR